MYICEGVRDSGTKFILIDETLLERGITKENFQNLYAYQRKLTIKKSSELVLCLFNALEHFRWRVDFKAVVWETTWILPTATLRHNAL
jgi:hypothetical protein